MTPSLAQGSHTVLISWKALILISDPLVLQNYLICQKAPDNVPMFVENNKLVDWYMISCILSVLQAAYAEINSLQTFPQVWKQCHIQWYMVPKSRWLRRYSENCL